MSLVKKEFEDKLQVFIENITDPNKNLHKKFLQYFLTLSKNQPITT